MHPVLNALQKAAKGLLYMSESDFPVKAFLWTKEEAGAADMTPERLLAYRKQAADAPVETVEFARFFEPLIQPEDWHEEEEREAVRRYQALQKTLQENLTGLVVYKVGDTQKDVYVIGKTPEGDFAGVSTKAVET